MLILLAFKDLVSLRRKRKAFPWVPILAKCNPSFNSGQPIDFLIFVIIGKSYVSIVAYDADDFNEMNKDIALYVHFPFCLRKCNYCSFVSYQDCQKDIPAYIKALKQELTSRVAGKNINTIYFGGGTPSLFSTEQLKGLLTEIRSVCRVRETAEITIEVNPGTIDERYFVDLHNSGVNRLSIGVQSLNNRELKILGRIHDSTEAKEAVLCARRAGFSNINIDLIYGIPGQTLQNWQTNLTEALKFNLEHLSLYALTLEGNEPMSKAIERGELPALDPDQCADQFEMAEEMLKKHQYSHYEISNWAKQGNECQHNLVYWQSQPYIGIGVAAHSFIDGRRFANTKDIRTYLDTFINNSQPILDVDEEINDELQLAESIILGLRLSKGINLIDIGKQFGKDVLNCYATQVSDLTGLGLLEVAGQTMRLTERGRLLGNEVFWRFLPA
jgi:oxygen-independent coproporphyrinogen III oxidase